MLNLSPDFTKALAQATLQLNFIDIDLTVARANVEFNIGGATYLYVPTTAFDSETVVSAAKTAGVAFARLNSTVSPAIFLQPGNTYRLDPTTRLYLTHTAQALKMMRIYYSTGPIVDPLAANATVSGFIDILTDYRAHQVGTSFVFTSFTIASTTILAPGTNVNGVVLNFITTSGPSTATSFGFFADTAAPAAHNDASKRCIWHADAVGNVLIDTWAPQMFLPAGIGIFSICGNTTGFYCVGFTIL